MIYTVILVKVGGEIVTWAHDSFKDAFRHAKDLSFLHKSRIVSHSNGKSVAMVIYASEAFTKGLTRLPQAV